MSTLPRNCHAGMCTPTSSNTAQFFCQIALLWKVTDTVCCVVFWAQVKALEKVCCVVFWAQVKALAFVTCVSVVWPHHHSASCTSSILRIEITVADFINALPSNSTILYFVVPSQNSDTAFLDYDTRSARKTAVT
jgi:hypothetical protein